VSGQPHCQENRYKKSSRERERVDEEEEEEEKCLGFLGVFFERFSDQRQRVCLLTFCFVFISVSENGRSDGKNCFFSTRLFFYYNFLIIFYYYFTYIVPYAT
jgi:hypothetical protein